LRSPPTVLKDDGWVWQPGVARRPDAGLVRVELGDPARCARCLAGQGCGAGPFLRLFRRASTSSIELQYDDDVVDGSRVWLGIDAQWLLKAAAAVYLMPLVALITVLGLFEWLLPGREWLALGLGLSAAGSVLALASRPQVWLGPPPLNLELADPGVEFGCTGKHVQTSCGDRG